MSYHFNVYDSDGTHAVLLFFIISGFCISRSADSSRSGWHFYAKRLGRLLPALIVCGFLTTAFKHLMPEIVPAGRSVNWSNYFYTLFALPSLNFLHKDYAPPDGAYWSLQVEFQFYLICALIIGIGLRRHLIPLLCIFTLMRALTFETGMNGNDFFVFFIAGLSVAASIDGRFKEAVLGFSSAVGIELYGLWQHFPEPMSAMTWSRFEVLAVGTASVYAAALYQPKNSPLSRTTTTIAVLGAISYPLYLIHQDVGKMLIRWGDLSLPYRAVLLPAFLAGLAWLVYVFVEKPTIRPLTRLLALSIKNTEQHQPLQTMRPAE
jgi:peptidoglycan/LPS O-acetylase OafA/YrhL